jgi:phosphoglycolate phosphatase
VGHRAVIFDLDGTLADTLADIAAAANWALQQAGAPPRPVEDYRHLAGQGVDYLVRHALGDGHAPHFAEVKRLYLQRYADHKYDRTGPFAGVPELLDALVERGLKLAVLSNKPDDATRQMVRDLFSQWPFDVVRGAVEGGPLKPDPASAIAVAEALGVAPGACIYVGDTRADMLTGKGAGMFTVGVLWGFRDEAELRDSGADVIVAAPLALTEHLE